MKPYDPNASDAENLASDHRNQGEGDREAARRYNTDVRAFVASDHNATDAAARAAASTLGTPTGAADAAAAARAKARAQPTLIERVKGVIHRVRNAIEARRKASATR